MDKKITIKQSDEGQRLDKFLVEKLESLSRTQIQKMIKNGLILINAKKVPAHYLLKTGDEIKISDSNVKTENEAVAVEEPKINLEIVYENDDYMIVNKPAGVLTHPTEKNEKNTLVDAILEKYPPIKKIGEDPRRPGIIHRLDKEASGLLVVAKTQNAFDHIKKQFKEKTVKKEYIALVHKPMEKNEGLIDFPIERAVNGKMKALPKTFKKEKQTAGKMAITEYEVIKNYKNYALLRINIKTGRTHQIRVHFNAIGHPIVGDSLYFKNKHREKIKLNRLFLHSSVLGFYDLNNKWVEYNLKIPPELKIIRDRLNGKI